MTDPEPAAAIPLFAVVPERFRDVAPVKPSPMRETEDERIERETLARRHVYARYIRRLPKRYSDARLRDLDPGQNPDERVSGWLGSGHQTLLLASTKPGIGKTHAAYAVGAQAVDEGLWVEAWTAMEMLSALRPNAGDPEAPVRVLADVTTCDLLILDDLGRERVNEWTTEQVHHVLDVRLREGRRTVVTTNMTAEDVMDRYTAPLYDRLVDDAVVVKVSGEGRRRPAAW